VTLERGKKEEIGRFVPALFLGSFQIVLHPLLVGVGIEMAALVFFPAAAPADIVPAQFGFLGFGFFVIKQAFQDFHDRSFSISPAPSAVASAKTAARSPLIALLFLRTGFVDHDVVSQKLSAVESSDGFFGGFGRFHFDKTESPAEARKLIADNGYGNNLSDFGEVGL